MSFLLFGGYFLYTEHAPWWFQTAFAGACVYEFWKERRK